MGALRDGKTSWTVADNAVGYKISPDLAPLGRLPVSRPPVELHECSIGRTHPLAYGVDGQFVCPCDYWTVEDCLKMTLDNNGPACEY